MSLLPLDDDKLKEASEFSPLPDFRVRILPVLGTLPALFGTTMASYVITKLVDWPMEPLAYKGRDKVYVRLQRDMLVSERRLAGKECVFFLQFILISISFKK